MRGDLFVGVYFTRVRCPLCRVGRLVFLRRTQRYECRSCGGSWTAEELDVKLKER